MKIADLPPGSEVTVDGGRWVKIERWITDDRFYAKDNHEYVTARIDTFASVKVDDPAIWRELVRIIPDRTIAGDLLEATDKRGKAFWRHLAGWHPGIQKWGREAQEAIFELSKGPLEFMEDSLHEDT